MDYFDNLDETGRFLIQRMGRRRKKLPLRLDESLERTIRDYLKNPTKAGIWRLHAPWEYDSGISKFITDMIRDKITTNPIIEFPVGKQILRVNLKEREESLAREINGKVSFLFQLFSYLKAAESSLDEEKKQDLQSLVEKDTQMIFEACDLDMVRTKYSEAYTFFVDNI
jgi:hypothetical protein